MAYGDELIIQLVHTLDANITRTLCPVCQGDRGTPALSIHRRPDGWNAGCFKCDSKAGDKITLSLEERLQLQRELTAMTSSGDRTPPGDVSRDFEPWATAWLSKYGINTNTTSDYGMLKGRLLIQFRDVRGHHNGYTLRKGPYGHGPKYLASTNPGQYHAGRVIEEKGTIVLVEDATSANRIAEAGYNSIALGTTTPNQTIIKLLDAYADQIIIWADTDEGGMITLRHFAKQFHRYTVVPLFGLPEPKAIPRNKIIEELKCKT